MKKIPCSYENCKNYRPHWEKPEEKRGIQFIEVSDDYNGPVYCSLSCAILDGKMFLREKKTFNLDN